MLTDRTLAFCRRAVGIMVDEGTVTADTLAARLKRSPKSVGNELARLRKYSRFIEKTKEGYRIAKGCELAARIWAAK
jgi:Mn-dependent DtxR family transcriptional regulator